MKAIVLTRYGSPEVLQLKEVAKPEPENQEVLVKVHATAVNDWDWCFVRGKPYLYRLMFGLVKPRVTVLGAEVAGTVEATGLRATRFQSGDHVYGDISEVGFGGFAEYVCVREDVLSRKPPGMTFEQAAALPHAAMLALQGLVDVGQLRQGESVLIIDYQMDDFTENGQCYDLILDTKTNRSPFRYLRSLNPGGRYVTVGGHLPRLFQAFCMGPPIAWVTGEQVRIVGLKPNKDLDYVNDLFRTNGLHCVIDGPYPLSDVPKAVQRFGEAKHVGKIVITVAP